MSFRPYCWKQFASPSSNRALGLPVVGKSRNQFTDTTAISTSMSLEAAKRADQRLKGLRNNGEVMVGPRVAGEVYAVLEHKEPRGDGFPDWLELNLPEDRLVASALLLQSAHPGSRVAVATEEMSYAQQARRGRDAVNRALRSGP